MASDRFLLAGVMGWPVMHSRSPLMHNYWIRQLGQNGSYVPLAIPPERLPEALHALEPLGFAGCNLTIPHKEQAMAVVDSVDETARRIGAISCVVVGRGGTLRGSNNDCFGFTESLRDEHPAWRPAHGPAVVIGAGGGSRAICYALAQAGVGEIRVVNRSEERARLLVEQFGAPLRALPWASRGDALEDAALVVNTTSQGMVGQPPLDLDLHRLSAHALAADIVYTPLQTPFLAAAAARGNPTINGLGMLLHQARPAWQAWFGIKPRVTPELRTLIETSLRPR